MSVLAPVRAFPTGDHPTGHPIDAGPSRPRRIFGRRGKLPPSPDVRRFECACGKLIIRCDGDPRVAIEGYCRDCKTHVVFET